MISPLPHAIQYEFETLDRVRPGWRAVIGNPGEETEFRAWLDRQSLAFRATIQTTWSAAVISTALDMFEASKGPLH